MENLAKAKALLILDHPFFASLFLSMPMIEDASVKTMATNGDEIRYNPEFVKSMSVSELLFVLAHETMHCVLQHMTRRGNRNHNRWNIAGDYLINDMLVKEKIGTMPQGGLLDSSIIAQSKGTTESIYDLLPESTEQQQPGTKGGSMDEVLDAGKQPGDGQGKDGQGLDESTRAQKEAETRVKIVQAANAAKMAGKLSGGIERVVKELTRTRTDWKTVLRRFLTERAKVDYSYARPKRRFLAEDIYLPSLVGEQLGEIVVAVDCSGSINERTLNMFSTEIRAICEDSSPKKIHVVYFDSEVLRHDQYEQGQDVEIKPAGGGGTAFQPVFDYIEEKGINPAACVFLTDLYGDSPTEPHYPVLWATIGSREAEFGEVVEIRE